MDYSIKSNKYSGSRAYQNKNYGEIRKQLQLPMALLKIMTQTSIDRNQVPMDFFTDAMQACVKVESLLEE